MTFIIGDHHQLQEIDYRIKKEKEERKSAKDKKPVLCYAIVKKGIEYKYKFANHARVKKKEAKKRSGFYDIRCES